MCVLLLWLLLLQAIRLLLERALWQKKSWSKNEDFGNYGLMFLKLMFFVGSAHLL